MSENLRQKAQEMARLGVLTDELLKVRDRLKPIEHQPLSIMEAKVTPMPLKLTKPFEASFGRFEEMTKVFVSLTMADPDGKTVKGVGEGSPLPFPWYDGESHDTVMTVLDKYILPQLQRVAPDGQSVVRPITSVDGLRQLYGDIVGHNMAKAAIEGAYWDAVGKMLGVPVSQLWGAERSVVDVGTSVGLEKTPQEMLKKIDTAVEQGVKRVKIKIKPGKDVEYVKAIRQKYPDLMLQVDGNAAYDLSNPEHINALAALDEFGLTMIEQPGPNDDRYYHVQASKKIKTPICLDESILNSRHAIEAIEMWAKEGILDRLIINIKPPRVGGFWEGVKIARICEAAGVPVWCGGMLESALGKTANVHFSALSAVNMPGDHVSQGAYYQNDVAEPLDAVDGLITVPTEPGWGVKNLQTDIY